MNYDNFIRGRDYSVEQEQTVITLFSFTLKSARASFLKMSPNREPVPSRNDLNCLGFKVMIYFNLFGDFPSESLINYAYNTAEAGERSYRVRV